MTFVDITLIRTPETGMIKLKLKHKILGKHSLAPWSFDIDDFSRKEYSCCKTIHNQSINPFPPFLTITM